MIRSGDTYDPTTDLRHYPLAMARFGLNPYGQNLYRIVMSDSRRHLIGEKEYFWTGTYDMIQPPAWVLERWMPPEEFAQCTREQWQERFLILGPYPDRGDYQHCYTFDAISIADANIEKLVVWIEEGRTRPYHEHRDACKRAYAKEIADVRAENRDLIYDKLPSFGSAPVSGFGGGSGTKTRPIVKFAEELNLPVGNNKFANLKG